jgi:hypothetical protein
MFGLRPEVFSFKRVRGVKEGRSQILFSINSEINTYTDFNNPCRIRHGLLKSPNNIFFVFFQN